MRIDDLDLCFLTEGITHIEDLPVDEFIRAVRNLNMYEISEKIDGANLQFGVDEEGKFFTSREGKGGQRYYKYEDWGNKFWQTGFKSAHIALSKVASSILSPGDVVEVEILFGELPNTVPYSGDENQLVFLRPIAGNPDIKQMADRLDGEKVEVSVDQVPYTEDGKTIQYRPEQHVWVFAKVPNVSSDSVTREEAKTIIDEKVQRLETFLKREIPVGSTKMAVLEILSIKLNQRPENINPNDWKIAKGEVKAKRDEVISQIRDMQLEIKNVLLNELVRNVRSAFGPELDAGGWIEGVVLRHKETGEQVKIVDKSVFTALNTFYNQIMHQIKDHRVADGIKNILTRGLADAIGHPKLGTTTAKKYLQSAGTNQDEVLQNLGQSVDVNSAKPAWISLIHQAEQKLEQLFADYQSSTRTIDIDFGAKGTRTFAHTGAASKKTIETFAEFKKFLSDMKSATQSAKTGADLVNILVGDKINSVSESQQLTEGGHAFPNVGAITREEVKPTLLNLSKIIGVPLTMLTSNLLGSAGKMPVSGDIDIALDANTYNPEEMLAKLKQTLGPDNATYLKGFNIVSMSFPIEYYDETFETNRPRTGRVQIDLMLGKTDWLKFRFFSPGEKSKYKGIYRAIILAAAASSMGHVVLNKDGELLGRFGPSLGTALGIQIQAKKRKIDKKGKLLKGEEKVSLEDFKKAFPEADIDAYGGKFQIDDPNEVARFLFGDVKSDVKASDLDSLEQILELVRKKPKQQQDAIIAKAVGGFKGSGLEIPAEMQQ